MPRCLGAFEEDDPQCEGNPVGKTEDERAPCAYRDRCLGFVKLMDITKRPRDYFVRTVETVTGPKAKHIHYTFANRDDFEGLVNEQILLWDIQGGRARNSKPLKARVIQKKPAKLTERLRPPKPTKAFARAGAKARSKQTRDGREKSREICQWYIKRVSARLGRKVAAFEEAARPGELFLVDRLESSNYCALYCKGKTKRIAITSVLYKPNKGLIEVRLAVPFEEYVTTCSRSERETLAPVDYTGKDGAFKVAILNVDSHNASLVAETLAKVDKRSGFKFPEARE